MILIKLLGVIFILMAIYLLCVYIEMPIAEILQIMFIIVFLAVGVSLVVYKG